MSHPLLLGQDRRFCRHHSSIPIAWLLVVVGLLLLGCGGEEQLTREWAIHVPESVESHEYRAVTPEERVSARIAVVRDLIVDSRRDDPNYLFYLAYTLAVDHDGNIYVLDRGNHRVQVFDKTGNHILTIGRDGQGPGELAAPLSIAIAGDHVVVSDVGTHRVTRWTLRGEYVDDSHVVFETGLSRIVGLADGSFVGSYKASRVSAEDVSYISISRFGADLIESIKYAELPFRVVRALVGNRRLTTAIITAAPSFAVSAQGNVYVTPGEEYEVMALEKSGKARWVLRVQWPRKEMPKSEIDVALDAIRSMGEAMSEPLSVQRSSIRSPTHLPALTSIHVDGHGHLYVFPFVYEESTSGLRERPVDVYSQTGEHLFSGLVSLPFTGLVRHQVPWMAALGDYVYAIIVDKAKDERQVVRYRLIEPF